MTYTIVGVMPKPAYEWAVENRIYMMDEQREAIENTYNQVVAEEEGASDFQLFSERFDIYAPVLPDFGVPLQLVHAEDVAQALVAAVLGRGEPGIYNLAARRRDHAVATSPGRWGGTASGCPGPPWT